mgnify:CR=1 FL=1
MAIACPQKPNGSMRVELEALRNTFGEQIQASQENMRAIITFVISSVVLLLLPRRLIHSAYMIWLAMYSNGAMIGMEATITHHRRIQQVQLEELIGLCGAAHIFAKLLIYVQAIGTTIIRNIQDTNMDSGLSCQFNNFVLAFNS